MQLGASTISLLPAVAVGVAVVLAGLVLCGVRRASRATGAAPAPARTGEPAEPEPGARDWTGEAAGGAADPPPPARPRTVADAVAARRADTEPMAAVTVGTPPTAWGAAEQAREPGPQPVADARPARTGAHRHDGDAPHDRSDRADRAAAPGAASPDDGAGPADRSIPATDDGRPVAGPDGAPAAPAAPAAPVEPVIGDGGVPERPGGIPSGAVPDLDEDTDGAAPVGTGLVPPPWSPARTASGGRTDGTVSPPEPASPEPASPEPVSFAVRQALAARAVQRARGRPDVPDLAADDVPPPAPDARDRLLAVLLDDPVTALGATTDLDDTRARIDQLGDVLRRRRADLATAVHRLHASGLTGEQIGRLSGMDGDDVREILERPSGEGGSAR